MRIQSAPPSISRRLFRPGWTDVVPKVLEPGALWPDDRTLGLWSLVLDARGIPHRVRRRSLAEGPGLSIQVQSWFVRRAVQEIRMFIAENPPMSAEIPRLYGRAQGGGQTTVLLMALLVLFHVVTTRAFPAFGIFPHTWDDLGSADAAGILGGQWWRTITALTLHGDGAHVWGNAVIGGTFIMLVCRRLGGGLGWLLVVLSGALGNGANALVLGPPHNAIGFSTAVFGAAGLLAGARPFFGRLVDQSESLRQRMRRFIRSAFVPVAAGLGLLAMLGAGGENTDLGAHLLGFVMGVLLGLMTGWVEARFGRPGNRLDAWLLGVALAIPSVAWAAAYSQ